MILCADDFGMTEGISQAILSLAEAGRLSATSALVTTRHWPAQAKAAARLRDRFAIGLHLNLTFGAPLGPMPNLAPDGILPRPSRLIRKAVSGQVNTAETEAEIGRQIERFEAEAGFPPDIVDGHQHVHVLPGIRRAVIAVLKRRFPESVIWLRDPSDVPINVLRRGVAVGKALCIGMLATGFRQLVFENGFQVNDGFSGFSSFGRVSYAREFDAFLRYPGPRHMIMCHPGFADSELGSGDPISERRCEEYRVLSTRRDIPDLVRLPERSDGLLRFGAS